MRRRDQIRKETEGTQAQLDELTEEADMLQKLLKEYMESNKNLPIKVELALSKNETE